MRNTYYILLCVATVILASCQKDLDIDYNDIEPFYVIQGEITDSPAKVLLTKTRNVDDGNKGKGLGDAEIVLKDDMGKSETLRFESDGYYHSPSGWKGETGRTYTLNVKLDGKEYRASSTMMPEVKLDSIQFVWLSSAGMKMLLLKYFNTFPKGEEQKYTYFLVKEHGNFYRNYTTKQVNSMFLHGANLVGCTTQQVMEEDEPEKQDAILHEGDKVHCELWSIDETMYNYFTTLENGQQNATNPISNFNSGVSGYFSAHHANVIDLTFSMKNIIE